MQSASRTVSYSLGIWISRAGTEGCVTRMCTGDWFSSHAQANRSVPLRGAHDPAVVPFLVPSPENCHSIARIRSNRISAQLIVSAPKPAAPVAAGWFECMTTSESPKPRSAEDSVSPRICERHLRTRLPTARRKMFKSRGVRLAPVPPHRRPPGRRTVPAPTSRTGPARPWSVTGDGTASIHTKDAQP